MGKIKKTLIPNPSKANMLTMIQIRVAFADTDAMGIVHHANYLRYFEVARVTWLREKGLDYRLWQEKGQHLPLVESYCRYKKPARFDDVLEISVKPRVDGVRIHMDYEVFNKASGDLIATGSTQHVCVDNAMKIRPIPKDMLSLL